MQPFQYQHRIALLRPVDIIKITPKIRGIGEGEFGWLGNNVLNL
jgi:hypothetical protein